MDVGAYRYDATSLLGGRDAAAFAAILPTSNQNDRFETRASPPVHGGYHFSDAFSMRVACASRTRRRSTSSITDRTCSLDAAEYGSSPRTGSQRGLSLQPEGMVSRRPPKASVPMERSAPFTPGQRRNGPAEELVAYEVHQTICSDRSLAEIRAVPGRLRTRASLCLRNAVQFPANPDPGRCFGADRSTCPLAPRSAIRRPHGSPG